MTTELTRIPQGTELALPSDLIGKAKRYAAKSRSKRTLEEYAKHWRAFEGWCKANGRYSLLVDGETNKTNVETLAGYLTSLADRGLSSSSIASSLSAIKFRHKSKGHRLETDGEVIQSILSGIRREIALTRTVRQVKPLTFKELREILEMLRPDVMREARDAAVLALAVGAGLRRSEVVGMDWQQAGAHEDERRLGFVKSEDNGLTVILMKSKASQDTAQDVPIPRNYAPMLCQTIEHWAKLANVQKGTPLFRGVKGRGWGTNPQSGYIGVSWHEGAGKWRAMAKLEGKLKHLGYFDDAFEAHKAYCKATGQRAQKPNAGAVMDPRMDVRLVAEIVKRRMRQYFEAQNKNSGRLKKRTKAEIDTLVSEYSGHSARAGCITSMAEAGVPHHKIKIHSRHKSDEMVSGYIRPVDKVKDWSLKNVAF